MLFLTRLGNQIWRVGNPKEGGLISTDQRFALVWLLLLAAAGWVRSDEVEYRTQSDKTITVEGNVLLEDSVGNMILEGRDGQHHIIGAKRVSKRIKSDTPVKPYNRDQLKVALLKEFGPDFKIHSTNHYIIVYSTSTEYAKQAGVLFERAYFVFTNYFGRRGFKIEHPDRPLIAIIAKSREEYIELLSEELGAEIASNTAGVYHPYSNRMYMYNAFGGDDGRQLARIAAANQDQGNNITMLLKEQNIGTVIHEGIHQIAFNSGFHSRHVANPRWLVEGMAMYFESPDLDARGGWSGVGDVNRERLERFQEIFPNFPVTLEEIVLGDKVFNSSATAHDAYAMSWALTYYLAKSKSPAYLKYLRIINDRAKLPVFQPYTPEERLKDFRTAFGKSPSDLELDFRRYMSRVVLKK